MLELILSDPKSIIITILGALSAIFFGYGKFKSAQTDKANAEKEKVQREAEIQKQRVEQAHEQLKAQEQIKKAQDEISNLTTSDIDERMQDYDRDRD